MFGPVANFRAALFLAMAIAVGGCAALSPSRKPTPAERAQEIEPMLAAAGFAMLPADTAQRKQQLSTLPPLTLSYYVGHTGKMHYWMADPQFCNCLYLGSEEAYQKYERMRTRQHLAEQEHRAAEESLEAASEEQMSLQSEMLNPYAPDPYSGLGWLPPGFFMY